MKTAKWNEAILASSDKTIEVEGNTYFPMESLNKSYFKPSATETTCSWKGVAKYFSLEANGKTNADAAWYYENPKDAAKQIKNYVAFWKGVAVG